MRLILLLILLFCAPLGAVAQDAAATAPDQAEAARLLADVLEDPTAREALVAQLRQAAEGTAAEPAAATIIDGSIARSLADQTRALAQGAWAIAMTVIATVTDFDGIKETIAGIDWRVILDDVIAIGAVVAASIGAVFILRLLTRPLRRRLAGRLSGAHWYSRLGGLLAVAAFDLIIIAIAWACGFGVALTMGNDGALDLRQSLFLNAFLMVEGSRLALRLFLAPDLPGLRFWPMTDTTAQEWYGRPSRMIALLGYGVLVAVPLARAAVSPGFGTFVQFLVVFTAGWLAIGLVLRNRVRVRAALMIRAARDPEGLVGRSLAALAGVWHLLAVLYVLGVLAVWTARPADSLGFVLRATLESALAVAIGTIAMVLLSRHISGGVRLSDKVKSTLPMLEGRLNTFVPRFLGVARIVLFIAVIFAILQVWNVFDAKNWLTDGSGGALARMLLSAATTLLIGAMLWLVVASWIDYRLNPDGTRPATNRERTLLSLMRNAFTVVLVTMTAMLTLSAIGVNIAPLLAGAGVVGLAIGFGAQSLVQDIITGAFIQFENAMNTGDVVTAGGITGVVEKLTIRSVALRDASGVYHLIPFSTVGPVSNFMKDFSYHVADMGVEYGADIVEVKAAMQDAFTELKAGEQGPVVIGGLDMQGVTGFGDSAVMVRARIMTLPGKQWALGREYNEILKRIFDARGIGIPYPHMTLYMGGDKSDKEERVLRNAGVLGADGQPANGTDPTPA